MKRTKLALVGLLALSALSPALGQQPQFPQNLAPNVVIGRLGTGPGPSQAIPFATLRPNLFPATTANQVYAGPTSGGLALPTFRSLAGADLPAPGASSLGGVQSLTCSTSNWFRTLSTSGIFGCSQPAVGDISGLGTGVATALGIAANGSGGVVAPTPTRAGDVPCYSGSVWDTLAGNNSGTQFLSENSSGACSWASSTFTPAAKSDQQAGTSNSLGVTPLHQQDHDGAAKAWVSFIGSTAAVQYNLTSVTRSSAGTYVITFATAFATANYVCQITPTGTTGGVIGTASTKTTNSININTLTTAGGGADPTGVVDVVCYGRQ
jgi:hypothetical protein